MKVTGVMCEVCERFSPTEDAPDGWFIVVRQGTSEPVEVCSAGCLCKVGRQIVRLEQENPKGAHPCTQCDKILKTKQGLATHVVRAHK